MGAYAFWIRVRDLPNGDAEVIRLTNSGKHYEAITVPVQERLAVARLLMNSVDAFDQDIERIDADAFKTVYSDYQNMRLGRGVTEESGPDDFACFRIALEQFEREVHVRAMAGEGDVLDYLEAAKRVAAMHHKQVYKLRAELDEVKRQLHEARGGG